MTTDEPEVLLLKIAILGGTGKEGKGLAMRWRKSGASVVIGSRDPHKAAKVAADLNEHLGGSHITGGSNHEASKSGDIVISTLPHEGHREVLLNCREALDGKLLLVATVV